MLCINYVKPDGTPHFLASKVFEVNGVKVGVIGVMDPRGGEFLNRNETEKVLAAEAARLKKEAHLVFAICHSGSKDCLEFSEVAPEVDEALGERDPVACAESALLRQPRELGKSV